MVYMKPNTLDPSVARIALGSRFLPVRGYYDDRPLRPHALHAL
jgi:hypothetical protein